MKKIKFLYELSLIIIPLVITEELVRRGYAERFHAGQWLLIVIAILGGIVCAGLSSKNNFTNKKI